MKQPVPVQSPIKGVNRVVNREGQPPDTCWDALNVLPFDRFGRRRVAQRNGLSKQYSSPLGSTLIQGLLPVHNINYPATLNSTGLLLFNEPFSYANGNLAATGSTTWTSTGSTNGVFVVASSKLNVTTSGSSTLGQNAVSQIPTGPTDHCTIAFNVAFNASATAPGNRRFWVVLDWGGSFDVSNEVTTPWKGAIAFDYVASGTGGAIGLRPTAFDQSGFPTVGTTISPPDATPVPITIDIDNQSNLTIKISGVTKLSHGFVFISATPKVTFSIGLNVVGSPTARMSDITIT